MAIDSNRMMQSIHDALFGAGDTRDIFSVIAYGVDVNLGVNNAAVATRAALAAAWANVRATGRRSTVYFPAGTYAFNTRSATREIDINGLHGIDICGVEGRTTLLFNGNGAAADWYLFTVRGGSYDIAFKHLDMDMAGITNPDPAEQAHLIQIGTNATDVRVSNCTFRNTVGDGIRFFGDFGVSVQDIVIQDCRFIDCGRAGVSFQRWTRRVTISRCQFWGGDDQQIDFEPTGYGLSADSTGDATTLVDPQALFVTWGIQPGDPVYNTLDNNIVEVVSVDSQTQLTMAVGATTWASANYHFIHHNYGHIITGNQMIREEGSGSEYPITLSGTYLTLFADNIVDGCLQGVDVMATTISRNLFRTPKAGQIGAPALQLIKASMLTQITDNVIIVRQDTYANGRAGISVTDQIRSPESITIARNQIRMNTRGIAINVDGALHASIRDNKIQLCTPDDTNQSAGINVRSTNFAMQFVEIVGNDIWATDGTYLNGIRLTANHSIVSCIIGGGQVADASNPIGFEESGGVFSTPPVLLPCVVEGDGSTVIALPTAMPWVLISGVGGQSNFSYRPGIYWGNSSPEGVLYAGIGSMALRRDADGQYFKTTAGTANTGWKLITHA